MDAMSSQVSFMWWLRLPLPTFFDEFMLRVKQLPCYDSGKRDYTIWARAVRRNRDPMKGREGRVKDDMA